MKELKTCIYNIVEKRYLDFVEKTKQAVGTPPELLWKIKHADIREKYKLNLMEKYSAVLWRKRS